MNLTNKEKMSIIEEHISDIERTIRYLVIYTQEELDARKEMGIEDFILSFISDQKAKILLLEEMIKEISSSL